MAVKDYVGSVITISQTLSFDIKELYKNLKLWFKDREYGVAEPKYAEKFISEGKKNVSFKWVCEKKMDPYTKLVIELTFDSKASDVVVEKDDKKHVVQEGEIKLTLAPYISRDIEDEWSLRKETGLQRFIREVYDKFSKKNKYEDYERRLKKDIDAIVYDIKTYVRQHRFD